MLRDLLIINVNSKTKTICKNKKTFRRSEFGAAVVIFNKIVCRRAEIEKKKKEKEKKKKEKKVMTSSIGFLVECDAVLKQYILYLHEVANQTSGDAGAQQALKKRRKGAQFRCFLLFSTL